MGWADGHLAAFDTETTGKDPLTARIVTASLVMVRPGHKQAITMEWLIAVDEPIPPEATAIHGITDEQAATGLPLAVVLAEVETALRLSWSSTAPLLVMNASYDLTLLAAERARCGLDVLAPPDAVARPVIDPLVCDRGLDPYRRGSRKLESLCTHYGCVRHGGAHTSTADALATARVVWRMARVWPQLATMALPELHHQQVAWHAAWAANYQDYLRAHGEPDAVIDGSWPVRIGVHA